MRLTLVRAPSVLAILVSFVALGWGVVAACGDALEPAGDPPADADAHDDVSGDVDADVDGPRLEIAPSSIDFGAVCLGETATVAVMVANLGDERVRLVEVHASGSPELSARLPAGHSGVLEPGASVEIQVDYTPGQASEDVGKLRIELEASPAPLVGEYDLVGQGVDCTDPEPNRCPVAEASGQIVVEDARPVDPQRAPATLMQATVPAAVRLVGLASTDPDGDGILDYQWSLVEAPSGASTTLFTNDSAAETEFQLLVVGRYVFELVVIDSRGQAGCDPARVEVHVLPPSGLYLELEWETDADLTDCLDCDADLDLHLLSPAPNAYWTERRGDNREGDCHYDNSNPDWGVYGASADDCELLRDTSRPGVEAVSIREPARTDGDWPDGYDAPYEVGVYFTGSNRATEPMYARLRVFTDGQPTPTAIWPTTAPRGRALVNAGTPLTNDGDFWRPGSIDWTAGGAVLHEIDTVQEGYPAWNAP